MIAISLLMLLIIAVPTGYLALLALASIRGPSSKSLKKQQPSSRFIIAIPAHDEAFVIANTVRRLYALDHPAEMFRVHIVADHCTDNTAEMVRRAGAIVHERNEGPRTGKGAALSWLFQRVLGVGECDAVVIFDADTQVDPNFLRVMDDRLQHGAQVIQGRHVISNSDNGWFPALTGAMFLVDNRLQNLGRANLGLSARNMGDSICFRADILRKIGWGQGLTEDYQLRQRLLLKGLRITYEPAAIGYGEAPLTWAQARAQRARWLRGTHDASQQFKQRLLVEGLKRKDVALLAGAAQAYFPSYSTLTLFGVFSLILHLLINQFTGRIFPKSLIGAWAVLVSFLFVYPLIGLALEKAPFKAYLTILSGPFFIVWRTWLALISRYGDREVTWIRTAHGEKE